jgi:hypothetical protein
VKLLGSESFVHAVSSLARDRAIDPINAEKLFNAIGLLT